MEALTELAKKFDGTRSYFPFVTMAQADGEISLYAHELQQLGEYSREAIQKHAFILASKLEVNGAKIDADKLRYYYSDN